MISYDNVAVLHDIILNYIMELYASFSKIFLSIWQYLRWAVSLVNLLVIIVLLLIIPLTCSVVLYIISWFTCASSFQVGFSHSNILRSIIHRACSRFPDLATYSERTGHFQRRSNSLQVNEVISKDKGIQKVFVLFGGDSSERQVSLISATNVWLNLRAFDDVSLLNI